MSSDFERLLREAGRGLPEPDADVTRRARELALRAVRRRSLRRPAAVLLAAALVALGVGIGALIAPSGTAAPAVAGLGFLPERGWSVLQNGGDGTPVRPAVAIAANVELSRDDDPDGLPLSTLETLPASGVVIVVSFVARGDQIYYDKYFPPRTLPLEVRDATRGIEYGADVRPGRPLGQYQLRAGVNRHNVDVNVYFGTDPPTPVLLAAAQRQLDRMVIRPEPARPIRPATSAPAAVDPSRIVDRTYRCSTVAVVGPRLLRVSMTNPKPTVSPPVPGSASFWTGSGGSGSSLVGFNARPSASRSTSGVYVSKKLCRTSAESVPLTSRGLPGPPVPYDQYLKCPATPRVLIRVRAVLDRKVSWSTSGDVLTARGNISSASLAARTEAGRPIALVTLADGKSRLWTAGSCTR
ncbi:MAG: hypothetical protein WD067_06715 [Gaiellaceae bacterium]